MTPQTLVENTAKMHGAQDLAGMLARDLVAARAALRRIADLPKSVPSGADAANWAFQIARQALGEDGAGL